MAIEKKTVITSYRAVLPRNSIDVAWQTQIIEDGQVIASTPGSQAFAPAHRLAMVDGKEVSKDPIVVLMDTIGAMENADAVKALAESVWTPEVVVTWEEQEAADNARMRTKLAGG